ncbi:hypothetical protein CLV63_102379 [Murinocardiopsis flavida]|uniref:Uncharacterized protein n=1 Tax=Murinocardiopsis flavida TaxID=645275 RepID=A0A2P8DSR5_9ACTN|nr:hypothetical protein [Murinocardiopsis flavida]PSL00252.1 hypothetical protein CLV63_102379 [Murinocardiopsis flavida]
MEARYLLARQTSRWARYADVTVRAEPAVRNEAVVSGAAFAWRLDVYGPGASYGEPYDNDAIAEARDGVRYALAVLSAGADPVRVEVTRIVDRLVDTGPGDVKFAAAHAVWRALGHEPADPPVLTPDGVPVFP